MKKSIVSILTVIAIFCMQLFGTKVFAINIDEATARQYGTYYLSMMTGGKVADDSQVSLVYEFMNPDLNIPAAYIFNVENQGCVIVSGSDLWYPILGYSTEGLFDVNRMAPSFKWYYESMCEYIIYSQNTGESIITDIEHEWDELKYQKIPESVTSKAANWLLDNAWGQGSTTDPTYNKMCPYTDKNGYTQTAYVGCVATAMSQIMHYWKYPVKPAEGRMGYSCRLDGKYYGYIDINLNEVTYDFEHMPNQLNYSSTTEEIDAVALLCYHAGVSVEMSYGLEGSGALSEDVPVAMRDIFLYDTTLKFVARSSGFNGVSETPVYTNEEWIAILSEEIESGRPMYYAGYSNEGSGRDVGGHAFVCDGKHPTNGKFHFNWGWDGQPNIWSDVRNNNLSADSYNFKFRQRIIRYLEPRRDDVGITENGIILSPAYPNPAMGQITIPYELNNHTVSVMNVYSVDGKLMESVSLNPVENKVMLDVNNYPKGLYIYKIGTTASKFVVK